MTFCFDRSLWIVGAIACAGFASTAGAQALSVLPVSIELGAGQRAAAMTVVNRGTIETSFQMRAFAWSQPRDGGDGLVASDSIVVSPPLGTIPPGGSQVVRIILRGLPQDRESSFRLLLDQIPAPAAPGTVRVALRLSMPVFALPDARVAPVLKFHVEQAADAYYLVASNDGNRHEKLQDVELRDASGSVFRIANGVSPYLLPGAIMRWRMTGPANARPGAGLVLSARAETVRIANQPVALKATS
jgi:fimbrial chaperone protein